LNCSGSGGTFSCKVHIYYPIVNEAVALLLWPRNMQVTVPVPPLPFDSICHDQPTLPLPPMVCAEPLNDTGALPVE
jgi:hypothetical protein